MKTRGEAISEYAVALKKEDGNMEVASILYEKLTWLFSGEHKMSEEMKIRCIAEEIDNILCGYARRDER